MTRLQARERARARLLGPPSKSPLQRAWAFADGGILRDREAVRARDEQFRTALDEARAKGVDLDFEAEALGLVLWQRAYRLGFENGRTAQRRDG